MTSSIFLENPQLSVPKLFKVIFSKIKKCLASKKRKSRKVFLNLLHLESQIKFLYAIRKFILSFLSKCMCKFL